MGVDEALEVSCDACRECSVTHEHAELDVAVEGCGSEVGGGDEDCFVVHNHRFGVQDSGRPGGIQGAGIVVDGGLGRAGPVCSPESVGEPADELVRGAGVAPDSLDVQEKSHSQVINGVHTLCEVLKGAGTVEVREGADPNRHLSPAEQLLRRPAGYPVRGVPALPDLTTLGRALGLC